MGDYDSETSVARGDVNVKGTSGTTSGIDAGTLFDVDGRGALRLVAAILQDAELRRSAVGITVLAAMLAYGAGEHFTTLPLRAMAESMGSSYSSWYKMVHRLEQLGYVALSRTRQQGQRLLMRVVWPQTTPTKTRKKRTKN